MQVDFVYANPRQEIAALVEAGGAPDTSLLGLNHLAEHGIEARILDSRVRRRNRQPGFAHRLTWAARELVAPFESNADFLITPLATLLPLAARTRGHPRTVLLNINVCTTLRRARATHRRLLEASLRSAHAIVCLAAAQRELLLRQVGLDERRVFVVPVGVDSAFYGPQPDPEVTHVVAVGRDLGRDYQTFVDAVRDLDVAATIVASEKNLKGVELPQNVRVELDASPRRLRDLYAAATCVVVPTHAAEFDRGADCSGQTVLLDAMAMGRPAIVTRRATLAEYVDDGRTALVVEPEAPAELRMAIERVIADRDLRTALGAAGRARVEAMYSTRDFAKRLAGVIEAVPR